MPHLLDISEGTCVRASTCVLSPLPAEGGRQTVPAAGRVEGARTGQPGEAEKGNHVSVRAAAGLGKAPETSFPLGLI